ncbi:MAG: DUF4388 domain-containing protein [Methylacidiphilales bacterium]|nr:DUF4388 domain-containing protein [Candidatus Methylacidiphilales bacterium]
MSAFSGSLKTSNLSQVLQKLVDGRKTGYLRFKEGEKEGFIALENGIILNALTGPYTALHALFQFVQWRGARIDFCEELISSDFGRDLAVYDPPVLISGVAYKEEELAILQGAIPSLDAVPYYVGAEAIESIETTPADRGLLLLADGRHSVREIAEEVKLSPFEVARIMARFRLVGALELVNPKPVKPLLAATG